MPRPPSPSIPEKEFVQTALKQGLRLDGRLPLELRQPVLTFGQDLGWVECAMGKTRCVQFLFGYMLLLIKAMCRVLAQVDGKMVKPTPERPLEGIISIHSEISPMASSDYEPGR